jgi:hypothetical protein
MRADNLKVGCNTGAGYTGAAQKIKMSEKSVKSEKASF